MKALRLTALLLVLSVLLAGCGAAGNYVPEDNNMAATGSGIYDVNADTGTSTEVETARKLIRTFTMSAETADLDVLLQDLDAKLSELGGYVQEKAVQNGKNGATRTATMTLRIPADKLDSFVDHVEGATNILSSTEKAEDVTLKYSDTLSLITTLETAEARLLELLEEATGLSEILQLESKLAEVRGQLATARAQLKVYDSLIDYGTVKLTVTEVKEYTVVEEEEPSAWQRIGTGFIQSVKGVWNILTELFIFVIVALPYLVIPGVVILLVVLHGRKKKKNKAPKQPKAPLWNPDEDVETPQG